ncbi:MAG: TonB-dependent receptor [bacterium]|nr:TonB-dependent receptor [bacterium]
MFYSTKTICLSLFICCAFSAKSQCKLVGKISSGVDTSEVGGAMIVLPDLNIQTQTDQRGKFEFKNVPHGFIKIHVLAGGFGNYSSAFLIKDSISFLSLVLFPSSNKLDEIVVYGQEESTRTKTANNIEVMDSKTMRELGAFNLSDGISKLPGASQLSTGIGISKPVIRGLFGNRIQTVLLGMRFDNQQWQDEHGLGISDSGVDRIEVIKGPASLLYGSEAMGGVLNIINEKNAPADKTQADVSTRLFSNTYGYAVDAGVKRSTQKTNWGVRLGTESHADYSDGNCTRILNSRFGGNMTKATYGFKIKRWVSENNYLFSRYNFGFIMDAYQVYGEADARTSRSFERPHHTVTLNLISSQNTFFLRSSKLKVNLGTHINNRQEQEGAGGISLDMLLKTYTGMFVWVKNFNENTELSVGSQDQYQTNLNQGSRIIVPDASLGESSLFAYLKKQFKYAVAEGGLRYDLKAIHTYETGNLNNGSLYKPGSNILPVNNLYNIVNGSCGISFFDLKHLNLKCNLSSGYRAPNLAELSSNGLHEGTLRYEVGNTNLKVEQNLCADLYADYYSTWMTVFANAYSNHFINYIYLQPSNDDYLGFKIYNYIQKNAVIQGFEAGIKFHPPVLKGIQVSSNYSGIQGKTSDHEYLPFMPAQKINNELRYVTSNVKKLKNCFVAAGFTYVFAQNTPNQFETSTPAYKLLNASLGAEISTEKRVLTISVSGNNLLNELYYDHLSRYKYFGIYNIGRTINLNFKLQFN